MARYRVIIAKAVNIVRIHMAAVKTYFHDHFVLFLLTVNVFLAILAAILVFLRLSTSRGNNFIVQYRSNLGVNAFKTGSVTEIIGFGIFALLVLGLNILMSIKTYKIHRYLAITILSLGILLIALDIIISNSLLVLH